MKNSLNGHDHDMTLWISQSNHQACVEQMLRSMKFLSDKDDVVSMKLGTANAEGLMQLDVKTKNSKIPREGRVLRVRDGGKEKTKA